MKLSLFAMPLKPGKINEYKDFIQECTGPKKKEYADLLKRYGLNSIHLWTHQFSGKDYALFIHNMEEDAPERLKSWSSSTHPFDQWFNKQLLNCYDIESTDKMPEQPEFFCAFNSQEE